MLSCYFKSSSRLSGFHSLSRASLLETFAQRLSGEGYSATAATQHIRAAEHFLYWTNQEEIATSDLTEATAERFAEHMKTCRCYGPRRASQVRSLYGVQLFLRMGVGVKPNVSSAIVAEGQAAALFQGFCQWMRLHRGTSDLTLYNYGNALKGFLSGIGEDPSKLDAQHLRRFVLQDSGVKGSKAAQRCTTALRMFIRFLVAEGKCSTLLLEAIPSVAHWRLSSLPKYLSPDEIERIIGSCDVAQSVGKRDRAILLLLARFGLRAGDVLRLRIPDIDWKSATIRVCGKGRRETLLPLTQEVGQAIVDYVREARPRVNTDVLFIRSRAPHRAFASHAAISVIVTRALERVGIACPSRGAAHLLRHSVATSMLRNGASLEDIAAVLRHRSIQTTQIYAKVDVNALREIAQPWPGAQSC
jgi:integrase/recombinase XerD